MPTPILYPDAITQIPYASFLEIKKLEYKKGLAEAKGATETLLTSGLAGLFSSIGNAAAFWYNSSQTQQNVLNTAVQAIQSTPGATVIYQDPNNPSGPGIDLRDQILAGRIDEIPDEVLEGIKLADGTPLTKDHLKKSYQTAKEEESKGVSKLNISLPNELQFGYNTNWSNTFKIGTLAQAFANSGGAFKTAISAIGGGVAGGFIAKQTAGAAQSALAPLLQGAAQGAAKAVNPFNMNGSLNPLDPAGLTNIVGLAGLAPNENAVQFFKNVDFREFTFTFEVFEDKPGSKKADEIVKFFKKGMHPSAPAGTGILSFPDVFILQPKFVPVGTDGKPQAPKDHYLLPRSKSCALTSLQVNVTPMNTIQTTYDGVFPLVTITVTFKEITALVKEDFDIKVGNGTGTY